MPISVFYCNMLSIDKNRLKLIIVLMFLYKLRLRLNKILDYLHLFNQNLLLDKSINCACNTHLTKLKNHHYTYPH